MKRGIVPLCYGVIVLVVFAFLKSNVGKITEASINSIVSTETRIHTVTPLPTNTNTPIPTETATATSTATSTATATVTYTPIDTPTPTVTPSPTYNYLGEMEFEVTWYLDSRVINRNRELTVSPVEGYVQAMMSLNLIGQGEILVDGESVYSIGKYSDDYGVGSVWIVTDSEYVYRGSTVGQSFYIFHMPKPVGYRFFEGERDFIKIDYPAALRTIFVILILDDGEVTFLGKLHPDAPHMVPWDGTL